MMTTDNRFLNGADEQWIDGGLEVAGERQHALIKLDEARIPIPTLRSCEEQLSGLNGFFARTQLGAIERKKQTHLRQILADAEGEILRTRTAAIIAAHRGLTQAALEEILVAAEQIGRHVIREAEIREQRTVQTAVLRVATQYRDFLAQLPTGLPPMALETVQRQAEAVFLQSIEKVRTASFQVKR